MQNVPDYDLREVPHDPRRPNNRRVPVTLWIIAALLIMFLVVTEFIVLRDSPLATPPTDPMPEPGDETLSEVRAPLGGEPNEHE